MLTATAGDMMVALRLCKASRTSVVKDWSLRPECIPIVVTSAKGLMVLFCKSASEVLADLEVD